MPPLLKYGDIEMFKHSGFSFLNHCVSCYPQGKKMVCLIFLSELTSQSTNSLQYSSIFQFFNLPSVQSYLQSPKLMKGIKTHLFYFCYSRHLFIFPTAFTKRILQNTDLRIS